MNNSHKALLWSLPLSAELMVSAEDTLNMQDTTHHIWLSVAHTRALLSSLEGREDD